MRDLSLLFTEGRPAGQAAAAARAMAFLTCLLAVSSGSARAGRPVYQKVSLAELAARSDFVFTGWPSQDKPVADCTSQTGRFWVHKVLKGDPTLENKVIALAEAGYGLHRQIRASGGHGPSYRLDLYKDQSLNRKQSSSFLFTNRRKDGCFELAAVGAQESSQNSLEVEAQFSPMDCDLQLRRFDSRAEAMPRECRLDTDCQIFYVHPNSCERPLVWSKTAAAKLDADFSRLRRSVRLACAERWGKQPACEADVFPIRCKASKCEEGRPLGDPKPRFQHAVMQESCAPHDASSVMIRLTGNARSEYPVLSINWWNGKPSAGGGVFRLPKSQDMSAYTASYCAYKQGCAIPKNVELEVRWPKGAVTGTLDFSFTTQDDDAFSGTATLRLSVGSGPALCG